MELGPYALIEAPSLIALIPMILYIFFSFNEKIDPVLNCIIAITAGCIITGQTPAMIGSMIASALGSTLGLIGFIMALGAGVGIQMSETGVSQTLCKWIVQGIGVNTEKKAILAVIACATTICALLGTMAGGLAIIAPVIIPVVAAVGLRPSTVGAVFQSAGETGLIWGPFTPPVVATLAITGLSYGSMMLWGALPYGIIWLIVIFFVGLYLQKKNHDVYELTEKEMIQDEITPRQKMTTIAFLVTFIALIAYSMFTSQGTSYVIFVMIVLAAVMAIFSGVNPTATTKNVLKGIKNSAHLWVLFVFLECFMNVIDVGGGFDALGSLFLNIMGEGNQSVVMIAGTLVGSFGINGGAVAQLQITHGLFEPALQAVGLPMELWVICLICGSRVTSSIYPGTNMLSPMGIARSSDLKAMLIGGWAVSMISVVYILIFSFVGPMLF